MKEIPQSVIKKKTEYKMLGLKCEGIPLFPFVLWFFKPVRITAASSDIVCFF
jgi:hypothetical protein